MGQLRYSIAGCVIVAFCGSAFADEREILKPLIEKAVKVAGVEKVQAVRAWTLTLKVTDRNEAMRSGTRRVFAQLPNQYRADHESKVYMDDGPIRMSRVINGRKGWRKVNNTTEELSPEDVARETANIRLHPSWSRDVGLLRDRNYRLALRGQTNIPGRAAVEVELARDGEPPIYLTFDKETCRLLKTERSRDDDQRSCTAYSDYRDVEGIQVPHRWRVKTDGNADGVSDVPGIGKVRVKAAVRPDDYTWELLELKFVDKLDAKLFDKP